MDELASKKRPVFGIHLKSKETVYKSFMSFIDGGALFIPTEKQLTLGQRLGLHVKLLDDEQVYKVKCKVVWITPQTTHGRWKPGIGAQFVGENADILRSKIDGLIAGMLESGKPTSTL
jgi:type IV pilus assembly protein PilZ